MSTNLYNKTMKFELAIHCFNYQKRLTWMLSSILQQTGQVPEIIVNISHSENNGTPTTESVIDFFKGKGLNIVSTVVPDNSKHNRSVARARQLANTKADWMIFADADMVYSRGFFEDLGRKAEELQNEALCLGADRVSLSIPFSENILSNDNEPYPREIINVESIVEKWPVYRIGGKHTAAGYFQLANVKSVRERNIEYPIKSRDHLRTYKADRAFRCVMGGRKGIDLKKQYHINHFRDMSETTQR